MDKRAKLSRSVVLTGSKVELDLPSGDSTVVNVTHESVNVLDKTQLAWHDDYPQHGVQELRDFVKLGRRVAPTPFLRSDEVGTRTLDQVDDWVNGIRHDESLGGRVGSTQHSEYRLDRSRRADPHSMTEVWCRIMELVFCASTPGAFQGQLPGPSDSLSFG